MLSISDTEVRHSVQKHFWMWVCRFVSWSSAGTDSLFLEDVWRQSGESERRLAFDLQQAGLSQHPPAKERVENWAGDLWAPLAWHPAGLRGEADGPSGDSLAQDRGCSVPGRTCVCVCVCVWHQQTGPRGFRRPPVLSLLFISFMYGQHSLTEHCLDISYPS